MTKKSLSWKEKRRLENKLNKFMEDVDREYGIKHIELLEKFKKMYKRYEKCGIDIMPYKFFYEERKKGPLWKIDSDSKLAPDGEYCE